MAEARRGVRDPRAAPPSPGRSMARPSSIAPMPGPSASCWRRRPAAVFTHWPIDNHADHRAISMLVHDAWIAMKRRFALFYYEVSDGEDTLQFAPTQFVDISGVEATNSPRLLAHASQSPERFYALQDQVARRRTWSAGAAGPRGSSVSCRGRGSPCRGGRRPATPCARFWERELPIRYDPNPVTRRAGIIPTPTGERSRLDATSDRRCRPRPSGRPASPVHLRLPADGPQHPRQAAERRPIRQPGQAGRGGAGASRRGGPFASCWSRSGPSAATPTSGTTRATA